MEEDLLVLEICLQRRVPKDPKITQHIRMMTVPKKHKQLKSIVNIKEFTNYKDLIYPVLFEICCCSQLSKYF